VLKNIYSLKPASVQSDNKHMILIQYANARDIFRYHFPHPQVVRYLGYRIGGEKGARGEK